MRELSQNLLLQTFAQSGDTIAQPTFTTDCDFSQPGSCVVDVGNGGNDGGNGGNNGGNDGNNGGSDTAAGEISLTSLSTNFSANTEFTVEVEIDSDGESLQSYTVKIEYPVTILQVVDANASQSGSQIEFTDTLFTQVENTANNTAGTILLQASSTSGQELSNTVARIRFRIMAEGQANITVVNTESSLVTLTSNNILTQATGLQIQAGSSIGTPSQITDDPLLPGGIASFPKDLPKSDLPFSGFVYMLIGIVLIYFGVLGRRLSRKQQA